MEYSRLYIDENGFLMCGELGKSTSIVNGLRFIPLNIKDPAKFDYEIKFINDLGWLCGGYDNKYCSPDYLMKNQ